MKAPQVLALDALLDPFGTEPGGAFDSFRGFVDEGRERCLAPWQGRHRDPHVSVYSGPEPPSGGVRRPPFAVIAPHWTQFDGRDLNGHLAVLAGLDLVDARRAHSRPELGRAPRGTAVCTRMWSGWSSRVRLPERNTDESLSNVSDPSGAG